MAAKVVEKAPRAIGSIEELKALGPDEINERWAQVSEFLEAMGKGWKPRKSGPPESIDDVKGMSQAEVLEHWDKIVEILEAEANKK